MNVKSSIIFAFTEDVKTCSECLDAIVILVIRLIVQVVSNIMAALNFSPLGSAYAIN